MGIIKDALMGIALYEGIKYWIKLNGTKRKEVEHITLGGKQFVQTNIYSLTAPKRRHHLDRPDITAEPNI